MTDTGVYGDFHQAVNMTATELRRWLDTSDSKAAGQKKENGRKNAADQKAGEKAEQRGRQGAEQKSDQKTGQKAGQGTEQKSDQKAGKDSQEAGQKGGTGPESTGHASGRKIVTILGKKKTDLTEADEKHMQKVVGYVHRHMAQRPSGDITDTRWRHSLMNWGHDPLKN